MSALVTLDSVTLRAPDGRTLFEDLTLALGRERIGLVGRNGVGKSSFLRLIAGEIAPAAGAVRISARVARLRQDLSPPPEATLSDLIGVSSPLARLARIERGDAGREDLDLADWTLPQRLEAALAGLNLEASALGRPAANLSGGEITRAALAALLVAAPDLILLDEPTNNLDAEGRAAVRDLLSAWRGGAVVVSHDRALLAGMDRILELSSLGVREFGGGWDLYAARRDEAAMAAAEDLEAARKAAARVRRAAQDARERKDRRDAAGKRSRARGDAPKTLLDSHAERAERTGGRQTLVAERLADAAARDLAAAEARIERVRRLAFDLPPSGLAPAKPVLAFQSVTFAWPGAAPVLRDVDLRILGPERVALVGPNGAGKSTWIGLATGELAPRSGRVTLGVRAARLDQHAAILDDRLTLLENFQRLNPAADANAAHAALARFLFRNTAALKLAGALSGGERLRAALACVLMGPSPPQLLILDEPTNHLDLDSIEAVEAALAAYDGALVVASHDEVFLEAVGARRRIELG